MQWARPSTDREKKKLIKYIMARFINVESRSVYLDT